MPTIREGKASQFRTTQQKNAVNSSINQISYTKISMFDFSKYIPQLHRQRVNTNSTSWSVKLKNTYRHDSE
eukprot:m.251233 g.251233  ORF g.251233 m.251233 type:complete len:71 (-) comp15448_c0_seq4:1303-1515(-)